MRIIPDQLRSKNLVPFKKRPGRYKIPGMTAENEALIERVDPDLSQEEQSYVRHYLSYADAFIKMAGENTPPEATPESAASSIQEGPTQQPPANPATDGNPAKAA